MCDTWVALADTTDDGRVILGKNSDRPIFDCQPLVLYPRRTWGADSPLRLEHVTLPQAAITYATLGSSPYWCWGYEEGINEFGVVIGNEAIYTKSFARAAAASDYSGKGQLGLLGMDLIRLALERARNAEEAVMVMGSLVEEYGQFGSGVPTRSHAEGGYDGSFLIADPTEAWVVETAGKRWAAQRFTQGATSISNQPSIRERWDRGSDDLEEYAVEMGWWPAECAEPFDFARAYIDDRRPRHLSQIRAMRTRQLLAESDGQVTTGWMKRIARDHYEESFLGGPYFDAADPDFLTICMHNSPANFTWGNTASSCVAVLPCSTNTANGLEDELPVFWWTPGPPCNGCYIPFFVHGSRLPATVSAAGAQGKLVTAPNLVAADTFSPDSYWWLFRELLDRTKGSDVGSIPGYYPRRNAQIRARFDALEEQFDAELPEVMARAMRLRQTDTAAMAAELDRFTARCVGRVVAAVEELLNVFAY
jgi:secernin